MYKVLDEIRDLFQNNFNTNHTAEATTSTTNIKVTGHGLQNGDMIINVTRSNASRTVTVVDANNLSVSEVDGQTAGDTITFCKYKKYYVGKIDEERAAIPVNGLPVLIVYGESTELQSRLETQRDVYQRNIVVKILTSSFSYAKSSEDDGDLLAQKNIYDLMEELDENAVPKATSILGLLRRNIRLTYSLFNNDVSINYDDFRIENKMYYRGTMRFSVTVHNARQ